jgi:hypothetical protein
MPISVQSGTAVNAPYLTENHGVPGSNPGPATLESPRNSGQIWRFDGAAEAPFLRRVNSRLKKGPLQARLWGELHAFCGVGVDGQGLSDIAVP